MRIGTDTSLNTCYNEGYLVMEYSKTKLMPKGAFDPFCSVRFIQHLPDYAKEESGWKIGDRSIILDVWLSANDVWEMYQESKASIDSCCDCYDTVFPTNDYDLLNLASNVEAYKGLL